MTQRLTVTTTNGNESIEFYEAWWAPGTLVAITLQANGWQSDTYFFDPLSIIP